MNQVLKLISRGLAGAMAMIICGSVVADTAQAPLPQTTMPQDIGVRLTLEGPVFVDVSGMTIYKLDRDSGFEACGNKRDSLLLQSTNEGRVDFDVSAPDSAMRRTCAQKHPPVLAPEKAKAAGKWSRRSMEGGGQQWLYDGAPLYTSIKDKLPGDTNAYAPFDPLGEGGESWIPAVAPLPGSPAQVTIKKTFVGLALTNRHGQTLYFAETEEVARSADSKVWTPLPAAVTASADRLPGWSIVNRADGSRQWAFKGKPLYMYKYDAGPDLAPGRMFADIFGGTYGRPIKGWRVALLLNPPGHPPEVRIETLTETDFGNHGRSTVAERVYADSRGRTLYTIHCREDTGDRLECDDIGDSPRYWLSFCGGEKRCSETWLPFLAQSSAKPIDNAWGIITIDSRSPWMAVSKESHPLTVWAYKGRPVFTYRHDIKPGDYNGSRPIVPDSMYAQPILAYENGVK